MFYVRIAVIWLLICSAYAAAQENKFVGFVSSASPEATDVGVSILEQGGNAFDAAVAVSLALGASEPPGSGIFGQTVMLVQPADGEAFVIHGSTKSPANIPENVTRQQLRRGHTATTIPSNLKVLSFAHRNYGSGDLSWEQVVNPAIEIYKNGFVVGPFRHGAFVDYAEGLKSNKEVASIFLKRDGSLYEIGETFRQPKMAETLSQIAKLGADEFYKGQIARDIAADMAENGGWITYDDMANFPDPKIVPALKTTYRGYEVLSLPPPFGGWIMLQILNLLELETPEPITEDNNQRRAALLNAMRLGHGTRVHDPAPGFYDYEDYINIKLSKEEAARMLDHYKNGVGGETTHFSVVDAEGNAIAVTQSIDSFFGGFAVHPKHGFLYNNYMQSFRLEDDGSPYVLKENEMPLSSMSATIVKKDGDTQLVLGSPGSARIISAVAQVTNYWIDVEQDIEKAVSTNRVHVVPNDSAYIEDPVVESELLKMLADYKFNLVRPTYGGTDPLSAYFGGVHALAKENGKWTGAADPRRDGTAKAAWKEED